MKYFSLKMLRNLRICIMKKAIDAACCYAKFPALFLFAALFCHLHLIRHSLTMCAITNRTVNCSPSCYFWKLDLQQWHSLGGKFAFFSRCFSAQCDFIFNGIKLPMSLWASQHFILLLLFGAAVPLGWSTLHRFALPLRLCGDNTFLLVDRSFAFGISNPLFFAVVAAAVASSLHSLHNPNPPFSSQSLLFGQW